MTIERPSIGRPSPNLRDEMTTKDSQPPPAEERALVLKIEGGSRSAIARLVADVRERHGSKADPLFSGLMFRCVECEGVPIVAASIFVNRRELIDKFMRPHRHVDVLAVVSVEGVAQLEQARYEQGRRVGDWSMGALDGVELVTIASGPPESIAAFAAATESPESAGLDGFFLAMRSSEMAREVHPQCVRLQHHVPAIQAVDPMSRAVADVFGDLRIEFFVLPDRETLMGLEAVFADGRIVEEWHRTKTRDQVTENAARRWCESTSRAADVALHERGR